MSLKEYYKLTKGVRIIFCLCQKTDTKLDRLKKESSIEKITTYMLKTMVVFMTPDGFKDDLTPCKCANEIYKRMLEFLESDISIPNFFLNESNSQYVYKF